MDKELLKIVFEDLEYLSVEWNQDIDDASLRRSSIVLRRLLVEGNLGDAARQVGKTILIIAPKEIKNNSDSSSERDDLFLAGGAKQKGVEIKGVQVINKFLSIEEIKKIAERQMNSIDKNHPIKISEFLKQTSAVISGVKINREEIIKYVANKLGGAHYNPKRKTTGKSSKINLEYKYTLLDRIRNTTNITDKNAIYFELLSIGQILINSPDIQELRKDLSTMSGSQGS